MLLPFLYSTKAEKNIVKPLITRKKVNMQTRVTHFPDKCIFELLELWQV